MINLHELPLDILIENILLYLDEKSLLNLSLVSRYFHRMANDEHIWKYLAFDTFHLSPDIDTGNVSWKDFYIRLSNTQVYVWGENDDGRLGISHITSRAVQTPSEIVELRHKGIVDIVSGGWSFHAVCASGLIYTWGIINAEDQNANLGRERYSNPALLQSREHPENRIRFKSISSGRSHVIGLAKDHSVWHWSNHHLLQQVDLSSVDSKVVQVSANWGYSCFLTESGELYRVSAPVPVRRNQTEPATPTTPTYELSMSDNEDRIEQIAGMAEYTMVLTHSGKVIKLHTSQSGIATSDRTELIHYNLSSRENTTGRKKIERRITAAFNHFAVYTVSGEVLLGDVETAEGDRPILLAELNHHNISRITFGDYHYGALTNQGELYTWGSYSMGALGHGNNRRAQVLPMKVSYLQNMFVFAIGFGGWQSSALAFPR
ncbi:regulator of chromosome condensation 1/beta-lactamase-inhibitor protein II [Pilobolus umbonatus]|nr:regulator of chromosome condensation 1/beta-lactamase-inhibitor protein II [Pilobolus umbonatus]